MSWYNRRVIEEFGKKIILSGSLYAGFLVQAMGEEGTTEKLRILKPKFIFANSHKS